MTIVLDASVVAPWILPDEKNALSDDAQRRMVEGGALVPELWWFEIGNLLISSERRNRLAKEKSDLFVDQLGNCDIQVDHYRHIADVMLLARRHSLTFYDAAYLEIAMRRTIPLATLDRELASAAKSAGVAVLSA